MKWKSNSDVLKKGDIVKHTCWECYNEEMKIYRISKSKVKDGEDVYYSYKCWVKCEKCGAVDDV